MTDLVAAVVDWGDVPTWIGALTTLGAFLTAGFLVFIEIKRERRAVDELAARREADERAEQANFVVAYPHKTEQTLIQVNNLSHLPVFNVSIEFENIEAGGSISLETLEMLTPGEHKAAYPREIVDVTDEGELNLDVRWRWAMRLLFTDTAGRRWLRDERGQLLRNTR